MDPRQSPQHAAQPDRDRKPRVLTLVIAYCAEPNVDFIVRDTRKHGHADPRA